MGGSHHCWVRDAWAPSLQLGLRIFCGGGYLGFYCGWSIQKDAEPVGQLSLRADFRGRVAGGGYGDARYLELLASLFQRYSVQSFAWLPFTGWFWPSTGKADLKEQSAHPKGNVELVLAVHCWHLAPCRVLSFSAVSNE